MTEKTSTHETPAAPGRTARPCWECRAEVGSEHFCLACGKIQPLPSTTDYFSFFALPRKLTLDGARLERRFHQLSWKLHPDQYHNASSYEQEVSLEKTSVLNDAYRTLRDPVARVEYLLSQEGLRREGETKQQAPPDLLAEVFDLNEHLEELRAAKSSGGDARAMAELRHRLEKARESFQEKLDAVLAELTARFGEWDQVVEGGDAAASRGLLRKMSEILNRHSYIRNLVRNVNDELVEE